MREFNTSGPCDPAQHYTVMREALVAEGCRLVEKGRYFTIFSPRQAGKTTYFQLLFRQLPPQEYLPIWISFEGLKKLTGADFYFAMTHFLQRELPTSSAPTSSNPAGGVRARQVRLIEPVKRVLHS